MHILISGGTGFIGTELCNHLLSQQHKIVVKSRSPESLGPDVRTVRMLSEVSDDEKFDVAINLAGEPIAGKRWTEKQKQKLLESRLEITEEFITFFRRVVHKPDVFISGSAIGYYGTGITDEVITEDSPGDDSFSSHLCASWEKAALQAEVLGIRTCLLRTGIVLGRDGGALQKMLPPFRMGAGGKIGSGRQWIPWIHLQDEIGIIAHCMHNADLRGPINCTAPHPVTNAGFTAALGKVLKRPTLLPMPALAVRLLFGAMGEELLLSGKKVLPGKAQQTGYQFRFEHIENALSDVLRK